MDFRKVINVLVCCALIGILSFMYFTPLRNLEDNKQYAPLKGKEVVTNYKSNTKIKKIEKSDCEIVTNKVNTAKVNTEDPELIQLIRDCYIEAPSSLAYNLTRPEVKDPSAGQAAFVDTTLKQMEGGFFVDCGANSGEELSNSLFLERYRNWTGILIEANPSVYKELKAKHRKVFTLNACLNSEPYPSAVTFLEDSWWGTIAKSNHSETYRGISRKGRYVQVQCFPLYSILLALNQFTVDYFSLDVEGAEEGVLNNIPFDKLEIKMMSIEYNKYPGGKNSLKAYMEQKGYKFATEIKGGSAADIVVVKEHLKNE